MSVATQITSFVGDIVRGVPPYSTIFRGLLSIISPFGPLAARTVSVQIQDPTTGNWVDTGVTAITDASGIFTAPIVWDPAYMSPGSYQIRAYFAGDYQFGACSSYQTVTVTMLPSGGNGGEGMNWLLVGGVVAIGLLAFTLVARRK